MSAPAPTVTSTDTRIPPYSWTVLALLFGVYSFNWMDRQVLVILLEPIRQDLQLSDTAAGLLSGFVFSTVYSFAGIPIARWADRSNRRSVIALALAAWSLMTVGAAFARGFASLAVARMGVAVCEAGCSPPAHSLISDYFPPRRRGTAIAIYSLGISVGIWAGLTLGGIINEHYGWRAAFLILGLPGLLLALTIRLVVREPPRGRYEAQVDNAPVPAREAAQRLWRTRSYVYAALGLGLIAFTGSGFENWTPAYLIRVLGLSSSEAGTLAGLVEGMAGILGTLGAGLLADRLAQRDPRWYLWMPLVGVVIYMPAMLWFLYGAGSGPGFHAAYWLSIFGIATYTAPLIAIGISLLPANLRALGSSVMLFVMNMLGVGGGTFAVGWVSDHLEPQFGIESLRHAIASTEVASLLGVACLLMAARQLPGELAKLRA